jgi:hypothetical protein
MRRSLTALAVAVAAAILACACGGGDAEASHRAAARRPRRPPIRSTCRPHRRSWPRWRTRASPAATWWTMARGGIGQFGVDATESVCTIDGESLSIFIVPTDQELSDLHRLFTDKIGELTDAAGQPVGTFHWVEVDHTVLVVQRPGPSENDRLAAIRDAAGGRIESVSELD